MQSGPISLYSRGSSVIHNIHPLNKLAFVVFTGVVVYCAPGGCWPDGFLLGACLLLALLAGVFARVWKFCWRTLLPIALFMVPIHGILSPDNQTIIATYHGISVYREGLTFAGTTILQLGTVLSASLLFVFTTNPADFITALTQSGFPPSLAYVFGSPLLMLPAMRHRTGVIQDAQRARGLDSQGSFFKRMRCAAPLVAPLVLGAFAEIEQRAIALELHGFSSSGPRTSLRVVRDTAMQLFLRRAMYLLCLVLFIYKMVLFIHVAY